MWDGWIAICIVTSLLLLLLSEVLNPCLLFVGTLLALTYCEVLTIDQAVAVGIRTSESTGWKLANIVFFDVVVIFV